MKVVDSFKKVKKYFTLADFILVIILLSLAVYLSLDMFSNERKFIVIKHKNQLIGKYSLEKNKMIDISDEIIVEVAEGKVRMLKNNCPNQLCVEQGWSSRFPIICVPNQVEITIIDKDNKNEIRQILK